MRLAFVGHSEGPGSRHGWELSVWEADCVGVTFAESLNKTAGKKRIFM